MAHEIDELTLLRQAVRTFIRDYVCWERNPNDFHLTDLDLSIEMAEEAMPGFHKQALEEYDAEQEEGD